MFNKQTGIKLHSLYEQKSRYKQQMQCFVFIAIVDQGSTPYFVRNVSWIKLYLRLRLHRYDSIWNRIILSAVRPCVYTVLLGTVPFSGSNWVHVRS